MLIDPVFFSPFWFIRDYTPLDFDPRDNPGTRDRAPHPRPLRSPRHRFPRPSCRPTPMSSRRRDTTISWKRWACAAAPSSTGTQSFPEAAAAKSCCCRATTGPCATPWPGPNLGLWGSYLIRTATGPTIYVSGDTAYFDGFDQIGAGVRHRPGGIQPGGLRAALVHGAKPYRPRPRPCRPSGS